MPTEVVMPRLGLNMKEGVLAKWLVADGQRVAKGQPLFVVETDKVTNQVEAETDGILRLVAPEGSTIPVAAVVGYILQEGEAVPASEQPAPPARLAGPVSAAAKPAARVLASPAARRRAEALGVDLRDVRGTGQGGRISVEDVEAHAASKRVEALPAARATPAARRLAAAVGVELAAVAPSGPGGRITRDDVERAAAHLAAPRPSAEEEMMVMPLEGPRAIIAERMHRSVQETAQVTLTMEVDATNLVEARTQVRYKTQGGSLVPPSYNAVLVKLVAEALAEYPYMNASLVEGAIHLKRDIHVGVAVDTERGLLVPVVRHANRKSIAQIDQELRTLAQRAQAGQSTLDDLSGGTFTITNLGALGVDAFTPIINYPEIAILGVGRIVPKVVAHEGGLFIRQRMTLSLTFDHRVVDGAPAARFLQRIGSLVESFRTDSPWWG
ncbi:MAG: dihydrolipoamide acetyltransferase family protein [Anaerolineae bacterium]